MSVTQVAVSVWSERAGWFLCSWGIYLAFNIVVYVYCARTVWCDLVMNEYVYVLAVTTGVSMIILVLWLVNCILWCCISGLVHILDAYMYSACDDL